MKKTAAITWKDFTKFHAAYGPYLPDFGEGNNRATQTAAVNKLIYKWFNDGDVYDNTYSCPAGPTTFRVTPTGSGQTPRRPATPSTASSTAKRRTITQSCCMTLQKTC